MKLISTAFCSAENLAGKFFDIAYICITRAFLVDEDMYGVLGKIASRNPLEWNKFDYGTIEFWIELTFPHIDDDYRSHFFIRSLRQVRCIAFFLSFLLSV